MTSIKKICIYQCDDVNIFKMGEPVFYQSDRKVTDIHFATFEGNSEVKIFANGELYAMFTDLPFAVYYH